MTKEVGNIVGKEPNTCNYISLLFSHFFSFFQIPLSFQNPFIQNGYNEGMFVILLTIKTELVIINRKGWVNSAMERKTN